MQQRILWKLEILPWENWNFVRRGNGWTKKLVACLFLLSRSRGGIYLKVNSLICNRCEQSWKSGIRSRTCIRKNTIHGWAFKSVCFSSVTKIFGKLLQYCENFSRMMFKNMDKFIRGGFRSSINPPPKSSGFLVLSFLIFVTLDAFCLSKVELQRTSCDLDPASSSSSCVCIFTLDAPPIKSSHAMAKASLES